jgi:PAS domain S-box-containing protein
MVDPVPLVGCPIDDVLATPVVETRPARAADFEGESKALMALARTLADSPQSILQELVDAALALTAAHSSGISLVEGTGRDAIFRWHATAGDFERYAGGTMPRNFSPCGTVLDRRSTLVMADPIRAYPYISKLHRPLREVLLVPFSRGSELIGTVWVVSHTEEKRFDREDLRLITNLAQFASMATKTLDEQTELKATGEALALERVRVSSALEAGAIGTWTWDIETDRIFPDDNLLKLFGLTREDDGGVPLSHLAAVIHTDDRDGFCGMLGDAMANNTSVGIECRILRHDGTSRWVDVRGRGIHHASGELMQISGIVLDISERKLLEIQDREAHQRKTEFLATLAHELRNPLAPIRNGLTLLGQGADHKSAQVKQMMDRQVSHLVRLVDDLMDVSRISSGKMELKRKLVSLRTLVENAMETSQSVIGAQAHVLCMHMPDEEVMLDADPVRIAQVFSNLLNNAAKYTPAGGRIEVVASVQGEEVVVEVSDTGVGIETADLARIFEMFGQVRDTLERSQGGLGIGLSLSKTLVSMHGGSLHAVSGGRGQGSTFTVRLPVAPATTMPQTTYTCETPVSHRVRRILIIDDNKDIRDSLEMILSADGHQVSVAATGSEGLEKALHENPDVALVDVGLPDLDGYDVAGRLRADPAFTGMLIAMTGWGSASDKKRAALAGFDLHLTKPVAPSELREVILRGR